MSVADVLDAVTAVLRAEHPDTIQVEQGARETLTITKDRLVLVGLKVSGTDESPVMDPDFGSLSYEVRIASSASITSGRDQAAANRTALEMWTDGVGFLRAGLDLQSLGLLSAVPSSAWSLSVVAHTKGRDAAVSWGYRVQEDYA